MAKGKDRLPLRIRFVRWIGSVASPNAEPADNMTMPPAAKSDTAFRLSGILTLATVLLVIVFGAILGARLYSILGMGSNHYKNQPVIYMKGGDTLRLSHPFVDEPVTVNTEMTTSMNSSDVLDDAVWLSDNGKQLLYINNKNGDRGDLYYRSIAKAKLGKAVNDSKGVLVAEQVLISSVGFTQNDKTVVYQRYDEALSQSMQNDMLCSWTDDKGEKLLDTATAKVLYIKQSGEIAYLRKVRGGQSLCVLQLPKKSSTPELRTVDTIVIDTYSINGGLIAYTTPATDGKYDLSMWDGKQTRRLASGIDTVLEIGAKGEVFYLIETLDYFDPMKYFEDDMAMQDVALVEPLEEQYMVESKNLWGKVTTSLDKKVYEKAVVEYEAKLHRDYIRATIDSRSKQVRSYSLCYNVGNSSTQVDASLVAVDSVDAASGTAVYYKERSGITERVKISQIAQSQDALRIIDSVRSNMLRDYYYVKAGTEPTVFQTTANNEELAVQLDSSRGLYFVKSETAADGALRKLAMYGGTLYYAPLEQDGLGLAKRIDSSVVAIDSRRLSDQRLYSKLTDADTVDLYTVVDGKKTKVAAGLSSDSQFYLHDELILGYRDYHSGRERGELVSARNRTKTIAELTHDYSYRTDDYIYLLTNYDVAEGYGDLYLYTGGSKLTLVDQMVSAIAE